MCLVGYHSWPLLTDQFALHISRYHSSVLHSVGMWQMLNGCPMPEGEKRRSCCSLSVPTNSICCHWCPRIPSKNDGRWILLLYQSFFVSVGRVESQYLFNLKTIKIFEVHLTVFCLSDFTTVLLKEHVVPSIFGKLGDGDDGEHFSFPFSLSLSLSLSFSPFLPLPHCKYEIHS